MVNGLLLWKSKLLQKSNQPALCMNNTEEKSRQMFCRLFKYLEFFVCAISLNHSFSVHPAHIRYLFPYALQKSGNEFLHLR